MILARDVLPFNGGNSARQLNGKDVSDGLWHWSVLSARDDGDGRFPAEGISKLFKAVRVNVGVSEANTGTNGCKAGEKGTTVDLRTPTGYRKQCDCSYGLRKSTTDRH